MDHILSLQEAIEFAKNFKNFDGVCMAVQFHPEWLTVIPENRMWAILHHIVFSGVTGHLDRILPLQLSNKEFRLLVETRDKQTALSIAKLHGDQSEMLKRIEKLVKLDEMLNYAKECMWNKCFDIVAENPIYGNEKPPYRRFYLIHHMAFANQIEQFEKFQTIENFKFNLTLRADRKKVNVIAREGNGAEFAQYIEKKYLTYFDDDEDNDDADHKYYEPSETAKNHTKYINCVIEQRNVLYESDLFSAPAEQLVRSEMDKKMKEKLLKQEKSIKQTNSTNKSHEHPKDAILSILTCSLTNAIVNDPGK